MLAGLLLPLGFEVRESASGRECLESLRESRPDAILLDIGMDDLDGWQTARMVRSAGMTDLPIIMVSADVFENRPENLEAAGAQAFVAKPVIESELLEALGRHLQLEWIMDPEAGALRPSGPFPPTAGLPGAPVAGIAPEMLATLRRLALTGQPRALRDAIDALAAAQPSLAATCAAWHCLVDTFDFDTLAEQFRMPNEAES